MGTNKAYTSTASNEDGAVTEATVYGNTPRGRSMEFARGVDHVKNDSYYGVAGTVEGADYDYEKQWSQRDD